MREASRAETSRLKHHRPPAIKRLSHITGKSSCRSDSGFFAHPTYSTQVGRPTLYRSRSLACNAAAAARRTLTSRSNSAVDSMESHSPGKWGPSTYIYRFGCDA